jgi:hypothetical protein
MRNFNVCEEQGSNLLTAFKYFSVWCQALGTFIMNLSTL